MVYALGVLACGAATLSRLASYFSLMAPKEK
jgi:hypothetical protein